MPSIPERVIGEKIMAYKNVSYNAASEIIRREERISRFGESHNDPEEREEEDWDRDFPRLKNKNKIEYWEQLTAPIES